MAAFIDEGPAQQRACVVRGRRKDSSDGLFEGFGGMPNPVDPFGMADLGFAQTPRELA
ncbi:hypothetical protein [Methylobacterium sp. Leaf118]|uniref:hypothetical protein n=1 Tax=Methylobacterium sp. Leaf118 TaxID=2876562 RepID=UPI001E5CC58B|nr:hypothetical protein [Methylobacterium sp. Leaf118]